MKYRICINVPASSPKDQLVQEMLDAMNAAGAGRVGNYNRVAYLTTGIETYRGDEKSWGNATKEIEVDSSVRIEMQCSEDKLPDIIKAIRALHPYEEPVIGLVKLEELPA